MRREINETIVITDPCYIKDTNPIMHSSTIYGDWSCMVYKGDLDTCTLPREWNKEYFDFFNKYNSTNDSEVKDELRENYVKFRNNWLAKEEVLGEFCADAGEVGVFMYNSLSDKDKKWIEERPHCATIIEGFKGTVSIETIDEEVHVIGKGNFNFFSTQSGL